MFQGFFSMRPKRGKRKEEEKSSSPEFREQGSKNSFQDGEVKGE